MVLLNKVGGRKLRALSPSGVVFMFISRILSSHTGTQALGLVFQPTVHRVHPYVRTTIHTSREDNTKHRTHRADSVHTLCTAFQLNSNPITISFFNSISSMGSICSGRGLVTRRVWPATLPARVRFSPWSVSYTHLDVYKRQVSTHTRYNRGVHKRW